MKCSVINERIPFYDELTESERREVDAHVSGCAQCRRLLDEAQAMHSIIRRASAFRPQPDDGLKLTAKVMKDVDEFRRNPHDSKRLWLDSPYLRYAMAACSIGMIMLFAAEQKAPETNDRKKPDTFVILNTSDMLQDLRQQLSSHDTESWYLCARQANCSHAIIQRIKTESYQ